MSLRTVAVATLATVALSAPLAELALAVGRPATPTAATISPQPSASGTKVNPSPRFNPQLEWPLAVFGANDMWRLSKGANVMIAVVDTGIDITNPDLAGAVIASGRVADQPAPDLSKDSHGTAVAGIIAGRGRVEVAGLAPEASLIDVKVAAQPDQVGPIAIADGIRTAAMRGAQIINVSLGTQSNTAALRAAVRFALERGCLIVASAGDQKTPLYPAAYGRVLSVGLASRQDLPVPGLEPVNVYAPGADLYSTSRDGGYRQHLNGSDYATAYVSAAAALLLSANPGLLTAQQAGKFLLLTSGVTKVLNPRAALARVTPPASPSPKPRPSGSSSRPAGGSSVSLLSWLIVILAAILVSIPALLWWITSRHGTSQPKQSSLQQTADGKGTSLSNEPTQPLQPSGPAKPFRPQWPSSWDQNW